MRQPESARPVAARQAWALGGMVFAASLLLLVGVWQVFLGIAALAGRGFFIVDPSYSYRWSIAAWGWIHLLLGVVLALAGLALFTGAVWARVLGITLALLSAFAHFLFLPYYPIASLVVIGGSVFIIWALANAPGPQGPPSEAAGAG